MPLSVERVLMRHNRKEINFIKIKRTTMANYSLREMEIM